MAVGIDQREHKADGFREVGRFQSLGEARVQPVLSVPPHLVVYKTARGQKKRGFFYSKQRQDKKGFDLILNKGRIKMGLFY